MLIILYVKDGGAFISGFKSSLTKTFNSICGGSFSGEQVRRGLDGFVSVKVHNVQFTNQQKSSLAIQKHEPLLLPQSLKHLRPPRRIIKKILIRLLLSFLRNRKQMKPANVLVIAILNMEKRKQQK